MKVVEEVGKVGCFYIYYGQESNINL